MLTQCKTLTCPRHITVLSQIMVAQSENLGADHRMAWQFIPSIIAERMIHVPQLTEPTTKLRMSSSKLKSRIW